MPTPDDYGITSETKSNGDNLIAGGLQTVQSAVTVVSGQNLVRGTVVGRISKGAAVAAAGTNTGTGGVSGTITVTPLIMPGVYTFKCTTAATNGGVFSVTTPTGERLLDAVVGTAYTSAHFSGITIADGGTDFALGDTFTVTVAAGSGKWKAFSASNTDGSETPRGILVHDCNATAGDKLASVFRIGEFNRAALTGCSTAAELIMEDLGIFVKGTN